MGALISKILNQSAEPKTVQAEGRIFEDPRSPSHEVQRTPIAYEKRPYLETDIDNVTPSLPLRVKLLKRVMDPRSPTDGIHRTPLSLLPPEEFDSPVSLYSNYQTDLESFSCMRSPSEPSFNVSDFESDRFSKELDSLVNQFNASLMADEIIEPNPVPLTRKPQPALSHETKQMCQSLVLEIIESFKECQAELKSPPKELADTPKASQLKLKKTRKPLSNITSAGNTPTKFKIKKDAKIVKVEKTGENSPLMVSNKPRVQWDQDATILI